MRVSIPSAPRTACQTSSCFGRARLSIAVASSGWVRPPESDEAPVTASRHRVVPPPLVASPHRRFESPHDTRPVFRSVRFWRVPLASIRGIDPPVVGTGFDDVLRFDRDGITLSRSGEDVVADPLQFVGVAEPCPGFDEPGFLGAETSRPIGTAPRQFTERCPLMR
jgi:hypothetical protein